MSRLFFALRFYVGIDMQNPKARIALLGAFLLLPFLGLGVWYWATRTSDTDDRLRRVVEKYGYRAVTPPSRLFGPGIFTTVEELSNGTLALRRTCIMNDGTLEAMWNKSPTADEKLFSAVEETFASSAKVLNSVESNTTGKRIKGSDLSLRNINVVTLSDEGLSSVSRQYLKGACEQVVVGNLRAGSDVCQAEEVLEADFVYKTKDQDRLRGGGKVEVAGQAAGSVNADQQRSEQFEQRGHELFLGARVSLLHCFKLDNGRIAKN